MMIIFSMPHRDRYRKTPLQPDNQNILLASKGNCTKHTYSPSLDGYTSLLPVCRRASRGWVMKSRLLCSMHRIFPCIPFNIYFWANKAKIFFPSLHSHDKFFRKAFVYHFHTPYCLIFLHFSDYIFHYIIVFMIISNMVRSLIQT